VIIDNLETIPGHQIKTHLGLVQGSTVRAKHAGKDFLPVLKISLVVNYVLIPNY
jgi:uncharacterized protein YbjQ (UPF0145 family)